MTANQRQPSNLPDLDATHDDGFKLVTLTFGINLYTDVSFYECRAAILGALDDFLKRAPDKVRFYATETMRAHKPATPRAVAMPRTWLKPAAPKKDWVALELKSGAVYQDAPEFKYHIWNVDKSKQANVLSLAYPARWALDEPEDMLASVERLAGVFPFTSGLAGLSFERSPYREQASETHAWTKSMRYPGIDIVRLPDDAKAAGSDGLRSVGWLTLLGKKLASELGGPRGLQRKLSKEIEVIEAKHGVIIKAGSTPQPGDINRGETLPLYREVYRLVAPLISIAQSRSMVFRLATERQEKTQAWYERFSE